MTRPAFRIPAALLALALAAGASFAADPAPVPVPKANPLKVEGRTAVVVEEFPLKLTAPPGATLYQWNVPAEVKGAALKNVYTVTSAAKGRWKLTCTYVTIDFDKKSVTEDAACTEFVIGDVPSPDPAPGPNPVPVPNPADPLAADLKALYLAEPATTRPADAARLAGVYRAAVVIAGREDVKTLSTLLESIRAASKAMLSDTAIVPVRKRLQPELATLGTDPAAALDDATRAKAKTLFARVAQALEVLK